MNRTVKPNPRKKSQGRPLAFLIAWLRQNRRFDCVDRARHVTMKSEITLEDRLAARMWANVTPSIAEALHKERPPHADEDDEPLVQQ